MSTDVTTQDRELDGNGILNILNGDAVNINVP